MYFSSQMILKLTQSSGVRIKQHFHSYEYGSVYEFFPLKLVEKIQANGLKMFTSTFLLTCLFFALWPSQSRCWRWEWNRPGICAAQTQTGRIVSHLWMQPPLRWTTVSDHYEETTVRMKGACFVQKHDEKREIMIAKRILAKKINKQNKKS